MRFITSGYLALGLVAVSMSAQAATHHNMDTQAVIDSSPNIEKVLKNLQTQHDQASSLIKSARQPLELSLESPLLATAQSSAAVSQEQDVLEKLTAVASNTVNKFSQSGLASWYGSKFHGRKTASGELFDMNAMTAAHRSLKLGSYVKVTNNTNGKSVVVKINDRGPYHGSRVLDLSKAAANKLGIISGGVGNVTIEKVSGP